MTEKDDYYEVTETELEDKLRDSYEEGHINGWNRGYNWCMVGSGVTLMICGIVMTLYDKHREKKES